jgi:spermidine synthase
MAQSRAASVSEHGLNLFLVGFLVLFLELASIRWFSANVVFLQFFTNVVLLASFLGMSCGCLAARQRFNWFWWFPLIAAGSFAAARFTFVLYSFWKGFVVDVGHQASPQEVFFGTEYRDPDLAQFVIPIEWIAGLFFVLIALMFAGLGQMLGRSFDAYPDRIKGYSLNIGGSLMGIVGFSALSFLQAPPAVWLLIVAAGVAYLLHRDGALTPVRGAALLLVIVFAAIPAQSSKLHDIRWSPYYAVDHNRDNNDIHVNNIGHQEMIPFDERGSMYSLIHLLQKQSGGAPFDDVMVIGAGSGNDLAHALRHGVKRIDAVEIDPVIQDIGIQHHPDQPYSDPRVVRHLDDGRHFLRTTEQKYDLVVYALVDSLILHSGYANIRLESYLFTEQAFQDVRRVLKPDGVFVMYNYYRQGWIVQRVAAMAAQVFGCEPLVLPMPFQDTLRASEPADFATIIAGCNQRIPLAFKQHGTFWLNSLPQENLGVDGFDGPPKSSTRGKWEPIAPTTLIADQASSSQLTTDDWPFLYVKDRLIPDLTIRSMLMLGGLGIAMVLLFMPKASPKASAKGSPEGRGGLRINIRMFFLGAGFMLLETKAVVQMALLFGSTWLVNSAVFFSALLLILCANLYVLKVPSVRLNLSYAALLASLAVSVLVPFDIFLSGGIVWRYVLPSLLALGPMLFAGIIFARSFRDEPHPEHAFGSNIAGSMIGGLAEQFSTLLGFQHLLVLALCFYLLSTWTPTLRARLSPAA